MLPGTRIQQSTPLSIIRPPYPLPLPLNTLPFFEPLHFFPLAGYLAYQRAPVQHQGTVVSLDTPIPRLRKLVPPSLYPEPCLRTTEQTWEAVLVCGLWYWLAALPESSSPFGCQISSPKLPSCSHTPSFFSSSSPNSLCSSILLRYPKPLFWIRLFLSYYTIRLSLLL